MFESVCASESVILIAVSYNTLQVWPDSAVKREIAYLKVKCENYMVGCDWKGLFKQLMVCPTIL